MRGRQSTGAHAYERARDLHRYHAGAESTFVPRAHAGAAQHTHGGSKAHTQQSVYEREQVGMQPGGSLGRSRMGDV